MAENKVGQFTPEKVALMLSQLSKEMRIDLGLDQEVLQTKLPDLFVEGSTVGNFVNRAAHAVDRTSKSVREDGGFEYVFVGPTDEDEAIMTAREVRWLPFPNTTRPNKDPIWSLQFQDHNSPFTSDDGNPQMFCAWYGDMNRDQSHYDSSGKVYVSGLFWADVTADASGIESASVNDRRNMLKTGDVEEIRRFEGYRGIQYGVKKYYIRGHGQIPESDTNLALERLLHADEQRYISLPIVQGNLMTTTVNVANGSFPLTLPIAVTPQPTA